MARKSLPEWQDVAMPVYEHPWTRKEYHAKRLSLHVTPKGLFPMPGTTAYMLVYMANKPSPDGNRAFSVRLNLHNKKSDKHIVFDSKTPSDDIQKAWDFAKSEAMRLARTAITTEIERMSAISNLLADIEAANHASH